MTTKTLRATGKFPGFQSQSTLLSVAKKILIQKKARQDVDPSKKRSKDFTDTPEKKTHVEATNPSLLDSLSSVTIVLNHWHL